MLTPKARGPLSEALADAIHGARETSSVAGFWRAGFWRAGFSGAGLPVASEDDLQISLWMLYELHYRGFEDAAADLEWDPALIEVRGRLEATLERRWRERAVGVDIEGTFDRGLARFIDDFESASISRAVQQSADREQVLELFRLRSVYHLKEADPTSWSLPRLPVRAQAALAAVQFDEYGAGDPARLHRHLFARGMAACGLRADEGAYVDDVPAIVLEQNNAMSMFGLHRRLRGASLGHFAAFEATSSGPSSRMAAGIRRVGLAEEMADYYDEHVEADAVHEQLALRQICGTLVEDEPEVRTDIIFGAFTCLDLEDRFARWMLERWSS